MAPIIIAHRGLHETLPENCLPAFVEAWKRGVNWCECDVHDTDVHEPVVFHDETLDRTTDGVGRLCDTPWSVIRTLRLKDAKGKLTRIHPPALREVLEAMPPSAHLLIEIKPPNAAKLVRQVIRLSGGRPITIQSFDERNLRHARALDHDLPLALLIEDGDALEQAIDGDWPILHIRHDLLDDDVMDALLLAGRTVGAWTVNEPDDIDRMLDLGVHRIISDHPRRVVHRIAERAGR